MSPRLRVALVAIATATFLVSCAAPPKPNGTADPSLPATGSPTTPAPKKPTTTKPGGPFATIQTAPISRTSPGASDVFETVGGTPPNSQPTRPPAAGSKPGTPRVAQPVPGKPGWIHNPVMPHAPPMDVRGLPSGTEVADPLTKEVFVIP